MKGKIPRILRLALVLVLVASFSLAPLAINPKPAAAVTAGYTVTPSPATAGSTSVYTIGPMTIGGANWTTSTTITVTFPAGTGVGATSVLTAGNVTVAAPTNATPIAATDTTGLQTVAGQAVTLTSPITVETTKTATIVFKAAAGIKNPPAPGSYTLSVTVATPTETIQVSAAYTIIGTVAAAGDMLIQVGPSPNQVGATANYLATSTFVPTITANVGDTLTIRSTTGSAFTANSVALSSAILANNSGVATIGGNALPQPIPTAATTTVTVTTAGTFTLGTLPAGTEVTATIIGTGVTGISVAIPGATDTPFLSGVKGTVASGGAVATITISGTGTFTLVVGLVSTASSGVRTIRTSDTYPGTVLSDAPPGDFNPGAVLTVTIGGTPYPTLPATPQVGVTVTTITDAGRGRFQFSMKVPELKRATAGSPHVIKISDGTTERTVNMVVNPKAMFTPDKGAKGTTITVSGQGFRSSSPIDLEIRTRTTPFSGGTALMVSQGLITSDANGSFSGTFKAPELMVTASNINARDGGAATANAWQLATESRVFGIDPSCTISPSSGMPGSRAVLDCSEFLSSSAITTFTIGGSAFSALGTLSTTAVSTAGRLTAASFTVPVGLTPGKKSVSVTATVASTGANTSASASFTTTALPLTVSPSSGPLGNEEEVTMSNMGANATAGADSITVGGANSTHSAFTADTSGNASVTITIPSTLTTVGAQTLVVTTTLPGPVTVSASGIYTVVKPTLTLTPSTQARGGTVAVAGLGWVLDKTVIINIGTGLGATTISVTPGSDGRISTSFTVPVDFSADSVNTITATDSSVGNAIDPITLRVPAPGITVTPTTVKWGEKMTIRGTGFKGGVNMRYELPWGTINTAASFPVASYTDSLGTFTATLTMPTLSKGVRSIGVTDGTSATTATIEVVEAAVTVVTALAPIATQLVRVWAFDGATQKWQLYDPAVPAELNTLAALNKGQGYFINVKAATSITSAGVAIPLSVGWNLIGWLG